MTLPPAVRPARADAAPVEGQGAPAAPWSRGHSLLAGALGVLALAVVLVVALVAGGGQPVPAAEGLPDAGRATGWGQPLVDLAVRLLAVLTVGQLAFAALLVPDDRGGLVGVRRALRWSTWSVAGWLLLEAAALVLTASALYGVPVASLSVQGVLAVLTLPVGRASLWVALLLVVVLIGTASSTRRAHARPLLLAALGAVVVPVVLSGHSATSENHVPAVVSLSVHVVSASLWVGGLVGLLLHGRDSCDVRAAVRRFSSLALGCVALLLVSGVMGALLVGGVPSPAWLDAGWARLLAVKTLLLVVLAGIGWRHRRGTLPRLASGRSGAFVRLAVVESAVMAATVAVSIALAAAPAPIAGSDFGPAPSRAAGEPVVDGSAVGGSAAGPVDESPDAGPAGAVGAAPAPAEDMSGHDHGDLSVSVLVDEERFHVAGTVRPGQPVTVYNGSDSAATITALDGSFDAQVSARTFITFEAPTEVGDYDFVSRADGTDVDGFADTLLVRTDP